MQFCLYVSIMHTASSGSCRKDTVPKLDDHLELFFQKWENDNDRFRGKLVDMNVTISENNQSGKSLTAKIVFPSIGPNICIRKNQISHRDMIRFFRSGQKFPLFMIIMMETGHIHRLFSRISTQPLWKLQMTTVKPLLMHG